MQTQTESQSIIEEVKGLQGIEAKKDFLRKTSDMCRMAQTLNPDLLDYTINEMIIQLYKAAGATTLKTFEGWKENGRKVKKGAKALIIWSGKKSGKEKEVSENESESQKEYKFFGVAHLFDFSDTEEA